MLKIKLRTCRRFHAVLLYSCAPYIHQYTGYTQQPLVVFTIHFSYVFDNKLKSNCKHNIYSGENSLFNSPKNVSWMNIIPFPIDISLQSLYKRKWDSSRVQHWHTVSISAYQYMLGSTWKRPLQLSTVLLNAVFVFFGRFSVFLLVILTYRQTCNFCTGYREQKFITSLDYKLISREVQPTVIPRSDL